MVLFDKKFFDMHIADSPEIIKKSKKASFDIFSSVGLPSPRQESWKYTDIRKIEFDKIPEGKENAEFICRNLPEGTIFCSIADAMVKHKNLFEKHLPNSLINVKDDYFAAMHGTFWNSGVFIYIPKNTEISLKNVFSFSGYVSSHTTIIVDENSSLTYTEEHHSENSDSFRTNGIEIFMKPNSRMKFLNFQKWGNGTINISNWKATLGKDSKADWVFGQFGGKISRIKIENIFAGSGSESKIYGVFYGNNRQHFDITTDAHHKTTDTSCDILVKGVLDDASSIYRGKIKIDKDAQRTNSYLSDHSLLFGEDSISNSIPSLEIDANDVKASHGATLGRPNEEEIFYLMARGLSKKEAERLIIQGYFSPVIDKIESIELRDGFNNAVENKIASR